MSQFYIKKKNKYLCIKRENKELFFSKKKNDAVMISNKRFAENIAYDYRANIEEVCENNYD